MWRKNREFTERTRLIGAYSARGYTLIAVLAFLTAIAAVAAWAFPVWPGDEELLTTVQGWQSPPLTAIFKTVTWLGWYPVAAVATLAAVAGLLLLRRLTDAALVGFCSTSALGSHLLKYLIGRPRPDYAIIESVPQNMGFPSGHAAFALMLGGALMYLAWQHGESRRVRWVLCAGLALLILAVGISRIYLGVHWPSDVLGGYLYGALMLALLVRLRDFIVERRRRGPGVDTTFPKVGI